MLRLIVILSLVLALLLSLAKYMPAQRKTLLSAATALFAGMLALGLWIVNFQDQSNNVDLEYIKLDQVTVTSRASNYRMDGVITNRLPGQGLSVIFLRMDMYDCPEKPVTSSSAVTDFSGCVIIGTAENKVAVEIPPGQARKIGKSFHFPQLQPAGETAWQVSVSGIEIQR